MMASWIEWAMASCWAGIRTEPLTEESSSQPEWFPTSLDGHGAGQSQPSWTSLGKQFRRLDPRPNILQETLKHETILAVPYLSSPQCLRRIWGCGYCCGGNPLSLHFHPGPRQSWSSSHICVGPTQDPDEACSSPGPEMSEGAHECRHPPAQQRSPGRPPWVLNGVELHLNSPIRLYLMQIVGCGLNNSHWVKKKKTTTQKTFLTHFFPFPHMLHFPKAQTSSWI